MAVKIHGSIRAVSVQRVILCLVEKGVEFELIHVDLDTMQHKTPEYLALHPFGKVPFIEDGEFKLYESRAIARYYAAKYWDKGTQLWGKTLEERAVVDQWVDVEAMSFDPLVFQVVFNLEILPRMGVQANRAAAQVALQKLDEVFDVYEDRLSWNKYLAGGEFSLADLSHVPAMRHLMEDASLSFLFARRKNLLAWWEDVSNRSAWKKVLKMELLG